jgi:hypothetical protein
MIVGSQSYRFESISKIPSISAAAGPTCQGSRWLARFPSRRSWQRFVGASQIPSLSLCYGRIADARAGGHRRRVRPIFPAGWRGISQVDRRRTDGGSQRSLDAIRRYIGQVAETSSNSSPATPAPERNWPRNSSTATARGGTGRSFASTARRSRRRCSRPSCSAMTKVCCQRSGFPDQSARWALRLRI